MFKEYSCGCVVLETEDITVVLASCQRTFHDDEFSFNVASRSEVNCFKDKTSKPLPLAVAVEYVKKIGKLVAAGNNFNTIRLLLKE